MYTDDEVLAFMNEYIIYDHCLFFDEKDDTVCQNELDKNVDNIKNALCNKHNNCLIDLDKLKKVFYFKLGCLLSTLHSAIGKETKEKLMFEIFELVVKNQYFIKNNDPKFAYTIFIKLLEFEVTDTFIFDPLHYLGVLFPNYNMLQIDI